MICTFCTCLNVHKMVATLHSNVLSGQRSMFTLKGLSPLSLYVIMKECGYMCGLEYYESMHPIEYRGAPQYVCFYGHGTKDLCVHKFNEY